MNCPFSICQMHGKLSVTFFDCSKSVDPQHQDAPRLFFSHLLYSEIARALVCQIQILCTGHLYACSSFYRVSAASHAGSFRPALPILLSSLLIAS